MAAVLLLLLILSGPVQAAGPGSHVEYVGGTLSVKERSGGIISAKGSETLAVQLRSTNLAVPYARINLVEYGQKVSRDYISAALISPLLLLAKKRQHFLTVGFVDEDGRQQAMVLRVGKRDIRAVLVSLEARTGRKVVYQDEEARKAGKG
jgi:hypothetical protein